MDTPFHNGPHRLPNSRVMFAALLLCLFCASLPASAADVILINESNIKPYRSAADGIRSSCTCSVQEFDLEDADEIEAALREAPAAVVAVGTNAFRRAQGIRNIPLVYSMVIPADTAGALAENMSGVSMDIAPGEYLDAMTGLFPDAKRIGLLYDPENTGQFVRVAEAAARDRGITLIAKQVRDPRRVPALLDELRKNIDVFWMLPDKTIIQPETVDYLMLISFQSGLPVFSFSVKYLDRGAAAALTISPFDMGVQAGKLVRSVTADRKGPVRNYARGATLTVNRKVCTKLGVRINEERTGAMKGWNNP